MDGLDGLDWFGLNIWFGYGLDGLDGLVLCYTDTNLESEATTLEPPSNHSAYSAYFVNLACFSNPKRQLSILPVNFSLFIILLYPMLTMYYCSLCIIVP